MLSAALDKHYADVNKPDHLALGLSCEEDTFEEFQQVVGYMYSGECQVTSSTIGGILRISSFYGVSLGIGWDREVASVQYIGHFEG